MGGIGNMNSFVSHKKQIVLTRCIVLFLFLFLFSVASFASLTVFENNTIWATIVDGTTPYSATNATISIYDPNTTLVVDSVNMSNLDVGIFYYNFEPQDIGQYLMRVVFSNTTSVVAIGDDTFQSTYESISEFSMIPFVLIIAITALGAYLLFLSKDMLQKPVGDTDKTLYQIFQPQNIGVFLHILVAWLGAVLVYVLHIMSLTTAYEGITLVLFQATLWIVGVYTFVYVLLYMVVRSAQAYDKKIFQFNK
jgi:hypothetical protein